MTSAHISLLIAGLLASAFAVQPSFTPERVVVAGKFLLPSPPSRAFEMFEPLGEKRWAPGWDPQPVYPSDLKPEDGVVFTTLGSKGRTSVWTITHYERGKSIAYSVVTPEHDVTQVIVECAAKGAGQTEVSVTYRITGLSEKGNEFAHDHARAFAEIMGHWREHISRALEAK